MPKTIDIPIRVTDMEPVRQLLDDAYEAICTLQSESWDVLSDEAREESRGVQKRLDSLRERLPRS